MRVFRFRKSDIQQILEPRLSILQISGRENIWIFVFVLLLRNKNSLDEEFEKFQKQKVCLIDKLG